MRHYIDEPKEIVSAVLVNDIDELLEKATSRLDDAAIAITAGTIGKEEFVLEKVRKIVAELRRIRDKIEDVQQEVSDLSEGAYF